jgi:hypothetical protein
MAKEIMHLHWHDKQMLFDYAGSGPSRRSEVTWKQVRSAAVGGMLTDYLFECRRVWRERSNSSSNKWIVME